MTTAAWKRDMRKRLKAHRQELLAQGRISKRPRKVRTKPPSDPKLAAHERLLRKLPVRNFTRLTRQDSGRKS